MNIIFRDSLARAVHHEANATEDLVVSLFDRYPGGYVEVRHESVAGMRIRFAFSLAQYRALVS